MAAPPPPSRLCPPVKALQTEATGQGKPAHVRAKDRGLGLYTVQHLLAGEGSPAIDTVERVAKALGMTIKAEKE